MPVDIDPNGIMPKINHLIRSREDYTRNQITLLFSDIDKVNITKVQNLVEIVTTLQLMHKITRHLFLTAKKTKKLSINFTTTNDDSICYGGSRSIERSSFFY